MTKTIEQAKQIIDLHLNNGNPVDVDKAYFWTNENINGYLASENFEGKEKALSVLASGDQAFNLIANDILTIDTFDINPLAEYYALGLKRAMILKYNYRMFLSKMNLLLNSNISIEEEIELIKGLFPFMEKSHREFWKAVLDYNYRLQKGNREKINILSMLTYGNHAWYASHLNEYLLSEENYEKLRSNLRLANITFKNMNAIDLGISFDGKYDFILLSNIIDYFCGRYGVSWSYDRYGEYKTSLEKLMNDEGVIFLKYLWWMGEYNNRLISMGNFYLYSDSLTDEQIITFPHDSDSNFLDGMVLKRMNK